MAAVGRPKDNIWEHFIEINQDSKVFAKCKTCDYKIQQKVCRMKAHYKKCSKLHQGDVNASDANDDDVKLTNKRSRSTTPPPTKRQATIPNVTSQPKIDESVIKTSIDLKQSLDVEVAKLFFACNIPFNVVEHPQFIKTLKMLRPGYKPPTRRCLSGPLLDAVHTEQQEQMKKEINGKAATLVQDGWSNVHNDPIVATCLQVDGQSFFLDSVDTGSMSKTADNCKKLAADSMTTAKEVYDCDVTTIVTDNAANMAKMRQGLKEDNPNITVYGCSAHMLNLLGDDVTPAPVIKHVKEVNKYFRNHHKPSAWLKDCPGSVKPQLPGETRWKSQMTCIDTFLTNRPFYMQICDHHEDEIDAAISKKVRDVNIFRNARDLKLQLKPIADAIDVCQSDNTSIADACNVWLELSEHKDLQPHKTVIDRRLKQTLTAEHFVAYKLHPTYKGEKLTDDQLQIVHDYLTERDPEYIATLIAFEGKAAPFPAAYFKESATAIRAVTWWKGIQMYKVPTPFAELAIHLLSAPSSSASIERVFSNFGVIHTKLRNRLGNEKASKLVFCYRMLRGQSEIDY